MRGCSVRGTLLGSECPGRPPGASSLQGSCVSPLACCQPPQQQPRPPRLGLTLTGPLAPRLPSGAVTGRWEAAGTSSPSLGLEPLALACPPAGGAWALCCPLRPRPQSVEKGGWFPDALMASGRAVLTELPWAGPWLPCATLRLGAWWLVCVIRARAPFPSFPSHYEGSPLPP